MWRWIKFSVTCGKKFRNGSEKVSAACGKSFRNGSENVVAGILRLLVGSMKKSFSFVFVNILLKIFGCFEKSV